MELKENDLKLYNELSSLYEEIQLCNMQIKIQTNILKQKTDRVAEIIKKMNEE